MKTKKKGFTLVELLVVIAILAILATVSVVGYLSFTEKAKQSKGETEMAQIREVIRGQLLDGNEICVSTGTDSHLTLYVNDGKVGTKDCPTEGHEHSDKNLLSTFSDLEVFEGTLSLDDDTITYTKDDVTTTWKLSEDTISAVVNK